jgi:hypothetical protein
MTIFCATNRIGHLVEHYFSRRALGRNFIKEKEKVLYKVYKQAYKTHRGAKAAEKAATKERGNGRAPEAPRLKKPAY